VGKILPSFHYEIQFDSEGERRYFVNGADVTGAIREPQISLAASQVAIHPEVRAQLVQIQREFGSKRSSVFEGRDMGTAVFPEADLKIFLAAKPEIRARRRYDELLAKFPDLADSLSFEQLLKEIEERDRTDTTRAISPLIQAKDAILIDTSLLSIEEVIDRIVSAYEAKKQYPRMKLSYWLVYSFARFFFKTFFRLRISGLEHFRPGAGILAANHCSNYDPPVLSISCPEEIHFLAKESLFKVPFLGWLIRILNSHPVSRNASDAQTFRHVLQLLQSGKKIILFPEGKRSITGELEPFERGLAFIAMKAKVPIFPAYIQGTFAAWPTGRKLPKLFGKITVSFGSAIEWSEFEGLGKREAEQLLGERTRNAILHLREIENRPS
jgi:cytidylate kinase